MFTSRRAATYERTADSLAPAPAVGEAATVFTRRLPIEKRSLFLQRLAAELERRGYYKPGSNP